jgi:hypothetical protein
MTFSLRFIPIAVAAILVTAMSLETEGRPSAADGIEFHAAAAEAVGDLPLQFGDWRGEEVAVPAAAQVLLKPNAILSRRFMNRRTGETVSMSLVQCRDTRDMSGHYPPICYPGMGWAEKSPAREVPIEVDGTRLIAMRYHFTRQFFDQERTLVVYNFFAMPGEGFPAEMGAIRRAASDYTSRPYGAAQVQVALNQAREPSEEKQLVQSVLMPCAPALRLLSDPNWKNR